MTKILYPKLHNVDWLREQIKNKPLRQIADELGCSYSAVVHASRLHKIQVPHRNRYNVTEAKSIAQKLAYKKKYPNGRYGVASPRWKGGKRISTGGHIYTYAPNHPNRTKAGYVMEHRLVAEQLLNRPLKMNEIVHHINGDKTDNLPENLQVVTRKEHSQIHAEAVKEVARLKAILDKNGIGY